jgi:ornithine decarboxylase
MELSPTKDIPTEIKQYAAASEEWLKLLQACDYSTPFQLFQLSKLQKNVRTLKKLLPEVETFYAIKSACETELIEYVDKLVDGYDIASLGEFQLLEKIGIQPERILYSNPVKITDHIAQTFKAGVRWYAFDSLAEIKKLAKHAPGANVYLRLEVSDYGSKFPLSKKFGTNPSQAVKYMSEAQDHGLNVRGLTFHVGSQSENPQTWDVALQTCGEVIKQAKAAGIKVDFVDIGGGFPVTYVNKIPSMQEIAIVIQDAIRKYLPKNVRLVAEPGRYISADASVIATTIIGREHRGNEEWLFLDMGVFQGLMEPLEMPDWRYPVFTDKPVGSTRLQTYTLTGPTCDAYDTIGFDYLLPSSLKVGDKLYISTVGAYTTVYGSEFNGFDPPSKHYIK